MANKLYPPQLAGSLPAFYKTYNKSTGEAIGLTLKIPYTMNQGVGYSQIDGFCLRIKNVSSGTYVCPPQYSVNFNMDKSYVTFEIAKEYATIFEEGQFYKVQLAYYSLETSPIIIGGNDFVVDESDPNAYKNIGYFSTVGIIKCVPYPKVIISGYSLDSTNLFTGSFLGVYDISDAIDKTETVYSYSFSIYNSVNELYYTTGELIHNSSNDVEYGLSTDSLIINDFISSTNDVYQIEYTINTLNGLTVSSPRYRMTSEQLLAPNKKIEVVVTPNPDEAYMNISFLGEKALNYEGKLEEDVYYGEFVLARACEEDGYTEWIEMHRFRLQDEKPSSVSFRDFTIKQGVKYKYGISQFNIWNIMSTRLESKEVSIDFEDMFLFDGERQLKIRFNPKMTKFGTNVLEQKVETLGNKYPFIFRNGKVEYKEFPISGLISWQMDNARLFYKTDYDLIINRKYTETNGIENEEGFFNHFDLTEDNILRERNFKLDVMDWLNNGKPKMFKSATEGNYIVRLFKVSLKPEDKLGRMLHSFSCTAYEIADFTYENLYKLGFVNKTSISRYVSLWKTYNFKDWEAGRDIVIEFDSEVSEFLIQDLLPGTKIELYQTGIDRPLDIVIGTTGSYRFTGGQQNVYKIIIPVAEGERLSGTMECQYTGLRYSDFDSIKDIKLKTIVSQQYVGVDPTLLALEKVSPDNITDEDIMSLNSRILNNQYSTIIKDGQIETTKSEQIYRALKIGTAGTHFDRFMAGDIVQLIRSDIFNFKKPKIKILNLEQAHFRLRDLIPIYKVPYEYLSQENQEYVQKHGGNPRPQTNIDNYDAPGGGLLFDAFFWSVTPFGQPYPIDEMTKIIRGDAMMNDPFCIFELFEYQNGEWVHFSNVWAIYPQGYKGYYYDAFYGEQMKAGTRGRALTDTYDPTFFIEDRMNYVPIDDNINEENNLSLNGTINILLNHPSLYIKNSENSYTLYYKEGQIVNTDAIGIDNYYYYQDVKFDDQLGAIEYYAPIKKEIVDTYFNNKNYYEDLLWVKDPYTKKYNKLKDVKINSMQNTLCLAQPNKIDLTYGREMHFNNIGEVNSLRIGNGVMAELTFQLQIIDYFTEENDYITAMAKKNYLNKSQYLQTIFEDYENIAVADSEFRKYQALYNAYTRLINGTEIQDVTELSALEHLIILALLNIKQVPRNVLFAIRETFNKGNIVWERLNALLEQGTLNYDFNTILTIIESEASIREIVAKYYTDSRTLGALNLMDNVEYQDLQKILTLDEIEGMVDKILKVQAILDEVNAKYNELITQQTELEKTFIEYKKNIDNRIEQYNELLRKWFMCLFLVETQLHRWEEDGEPAGPYSLSDIKSYYQKLEYQLEDEIENEEATITTGYVQAEGYIAQIEAHLEELRTYEKIKRDKQNDALFDEYVTNKEYSEIESIFVLLQLLYTTYDKWKIEDAKQNYKLQRMYNETYNSVIIFFMEYEDFRNLLNVIKTTFALSENKCNNLLENIKSFYPDYQDNLIAVPKEEIVEESKPIIQEYAIAVDKLSLSVDFYLNRLKATVNQDVGLEQRMKNAKALHTKQRDDMITHFFTVAEQNEIESERPQPDNNNSNTGPNSVISSNLANNENVYFIAGFSQTIPDIKETLTVEQKIEKKNRVQVLLELITALENSLTGEITPGSIISEINRNYLTQKRVNYPSLVGVIYSGYCQAGLNSIVKNLNSFIEVRRTEWVTALKDNCLSSDAFERFYLDNEDLQLKYPTYTDLLIALELRKSSWVELKNENPEFTDEDVAEYIASIFYDKILWEGELKIYLDEINNARRLENQSIIPYPEEYRVDFAKDAKYKYLSNDSFQPNGTLNQVIATNNASDVVKILGDLKDIQKLNFKVDITDTDDQFQLNGLFEQFSTANLQNEDQPNLEAQIRLAYFNNGLFVYSLNEFLPQIIGNKFEEKTSGIFYWYVRYSLFKNLKYYLKLLEQASILLADYSARKDNYATKQADYLAKYQNAEAIYKSYANSEAFKYYQGNAESKQDTIKKAIKDMQDAWNNFVLTLDRAFTEEIERGMYV